MEKYETNPFIAHSWAIFILFSLTYESRHRTPTNPFSKRLVHSIWNKIGETNPGFRDIKRQFDVYFHPYRPIFPLLQATDLT